MALMRTSNPALNAKTFADVRRDPTAPAMTVEGTVNRTAFLLFLVVLPAAWVWAQVRTALHPPGAGPRIEGPADLRPHPRRGPKGARLDSRPPVISHLAFCL